MVKNARLLVLVVLLLASVIAIGQAISGDLVGTVLDKSGAVIPNATVTALNTATNVKTTVKTNTNGEYRFSNLPVGSYDITFTAEGFGAKTIRKTSVELNKTATLNATMEVGNVATTVEVTDAAPTIDTTTAQVQTTYQLQAVQDLPTAALNVLNLSLLQAGVGSSGGMGAGSGPSVGGQRPRNNNFMVEGVDNNDKGVTGPVVQVPNEAIQDFTVMQNQFSPEFGHSTGGQFNQVVISGTNSFHGGAYEYFQNRNLNAIDQSIARQYTPEEVAQGLVKNPRFDNNRFGGKIGGPIIKNKLFFFFNYEYNPIGLSTTPSAPYYLPTAAGYTTLLSLPGVSANNINTLKQYATAPSAGGCSIGSSHATSFTVSGASIECGIVPVTAPNFTNNKALVASLDYNLSDKDQIRGRFIRTNSSFTDTSAALPVFYSTLSTPIYLFAFNEFHTFSPNVSNEFRVGYNRSGYNYTVPSMKFPGLDAFPNITIDDTNLNLGPDPNAPQYAITNTYQATNNLTVIKGAHSLKFGGGFTRWISPQLFIQRARGDYEWNTLDAYVHDLVPAFAERSVGTVGYSGDQYMINWFVNDTWKVRSNLSLTLGLRHEFLSTPYGWTQQAMNHVADVPGLITFASPKAPLTDFMPRIGFAYSPGSSGNTSVRGGFGMGYDVLYDNIGTLSRPPQIGSTVDCPGAPSCPLSNFLANGAIPPGGSGITELDQATARAYTSSFLPDKIKYPYSLQWNLGVQRVFKTNYTFETRYVGTRGVHLNVQDRFNVQPLITPARYLPTYMSQPSPATLNALPYNLGALEDILNNGGNITPAYANAGLTNPIVGFMPWGGSSYHGLATQLNRRFSNGLYVQGSWTWSHTIDDSTADFFSTVLTPRRPQDFLNLHAERSNSALSRTHRFTLAVVYDVPWMKNSNALLKNVVGNWTLAPVYTFETGEWASVQSAVDSNLNGDNAGDRAIFNPSGIPGTGSGVTSLCTSGLAAAITAGTIPSGTACGAVDPDGNWSTHPYVVGYLANNPNAQYILAGQGALANSGRNTLQMPGISNLDLTLKKVVSVTERYKVEFSALMLNSMNHPQYIGGSLNQITSIGWTSTAVKNYLTPGKPDFNQANKVLPSNSRTMILGLRFTF